MATISRAVGRVWVSQKWPADKRGRALQPSFAGSLGGIYEVHKFFQAVATWWQGHCLGLPHQRSDGVEHSRQLGNSWQVGRILVEMLAPGCENAPRHGSQAE
mmetsp:Transcript_99927/g.254179  ORF Transcript_99927/g.254179 Transcript_99927/m.254179 type:complete len:102 (-) Transcript_99927:67-372(-)